MRHAAPWRINRAHLCVRGNPIGNPPFDPNSVSNTHYLKNRRLGPSMFGANFSFHCRPPHYCVCAALEVSGVSVLHSARNFSRGWKTLVTERFDPPRPVSKSCENLQQFHGAVTCTDV
jgi:hypothetical protein